MKEYNLHRGDYFGKNDNATEKYNKELVPLLMKLGITKEKDLDKIFNVVDDIVSEACPALMQPMKLYVKNMNTTKNYD